jgi:methylmalonyl-CoA decarboxylase
MSLIVVTTQDDIGFVTLNHPKKHNALSEKLVQEIIVALATFRKHGVRVVILRAQPGAKVWSAGHDVAELPESRRDPLGWDDPLRLLIRDIETLPAPVIAMIEGTVWGGACETAFACDLIVASPDTTFAVTPAKLGVPYNVTGMVTLMNSANLRIVKEMAFTAQPITARRAEELGMINYVVSVPEPCTPPFRSLPPESVAPAKPALEAREHHARELERPTLRFVHNLKAGARSAAIVRWARLTRTFPTSRLSGPCLCGRGRRARD